MEIVPYPFMYSSKYYANNSKESSEWYKQNWTEYIGQSTIAKYTVDSIGSHLKKVSQEQIQAINETSQTLAQINTAGFTGIGELISASTAQNSKHYDKVVSQLESLAEHTQDLIKQNTYNTEIVVSEIVNLGGKFSIIIEQQSASYQLLHGIEKILKIPESQIQRIHLIETGLKFFRKANEEEEFISDALENFLDAEKLLPSDSFVLYHLGLFYFYFPNNVDIDRAIYYFTRAAKYSIIERDSSYEIIKDLNSVDSVFGNNFTSKCYYQASFANYVLGNYDDALKIIDKALLYQPNEIAYLIHKVRVLACLNKIQESIQLCSSILSTNINQINYLANDIILVSHSEFTQLFNEIISDFKSKVLRIFHNVKKIILKGSVFMKEVEKLELSLKSDSFSDILNLNRQLTDMSWNLNISYQNIIISKLKTSKKPKSQFDVIKFNATKLNLIGGEYQIEFPIEKVNESGNLLDLVMYERKLINNCNVKIDSVLKYLDKSEFKETFEEASKFVISESINDLPNICNNLKDALKRQDKLISNVNKEIEKEKKVHEEKIYDRCYKIIFVINHTFSDSSDARFSDNHLKKEKELILLWNSEMAGFKCEKILSRVIRNLDASKSHNYKNTYDKLTSNVKSKCEFSLKENWLVTIRKSVTELMNLNYEYLYDYLIYLQRVQNKISFLETSMSFWGNTKYNEIDVRNGKLLELELNKYISEINKNQNKNSV